MKSVKSLVLALGCLSVGQSGVAADAPKPNFIFILTDDQGWPMMSEPMDPDVKDSAIGYFHTPAMNRLAREGMRFASGYSSAPSCTPTRRSVQNGMTPARQRGTEFKSQWVPADHLTLPRALKQADPAYVCAHFGKWGEDMISTPEQCGYDVSDGMTGNVTGGMGANRQERFSFLLNEDPKQTFALTRRATDFMEQQAEGKRPFYMQVCYYAVHRQIQASPTTYEKYASKGKPPRRFPRVFAAMLEDLNAGMTRLLDRVDQLGIAGNTYVVFSADNGANAFYNNTDESLPTNNHPLRLGKAYLYEGGIRVPFIVRGPGVKPGSVSRVPVAQYDLLPTFYDLAGGRAPLPADVDGGSFRALLENDGRGAVKRALPGLVFHKPLLAPLPHSALRIGDMKLVVNWRTGERELFNLSEDIGEVKNLAEAMPEETTRMFDLLLNYLKSVNAETAVQPHPKQPPRKNKS